MKVLRYKFSGNVNQLHDELLAAFPVLAKSTKRTEELMEPVYEDITVPKLSGRLDNRGAPEVVAEIVGQREIGQRVRKVISYEAPNLAVLGDGTDLELHVIDGIDETAIAKLVRDYKDKPISPPTDYMAEIAKAKTVDDLKGVLSEFFKRTEGSPSRVATD